MLDQRQIRLASFQKSHRGGGEPEPKPSLVYLVNIQQHIHSAQSASLQMPVMTFKRVCGSAVEKARPPPRRRVAKLGFVIMFPDYTISCSTFRRNARLRPLISYRPLLTGSKVKYNWKHP